jgi:hypothetical protein
MSHEQEMADVLITIQEKIRDIQALVQNDDEEQEVKDLLMYMMKEHFDIDCKDDFLHVTALTPSPASSSPASSSGSPQRLSQLSPPSRKRTRTHGGRRKPSLKRRTHRRT